MKAVMAAAGIFVLFLTMGGCAQFQMTCFDKRGLIEKKEVMLVTFQDLHEMCLLEKL